MIRKYHNHKPRTTNKHREEEPLNHHETPGRQIKHRVEERKKNKREKEKNYNFR